jgi:N-acetylglucosaminyldiphosphoundecaprenol N-acetyl-beta-D-mannosaminyltransferase
MKSAVSYLDAVISSNSKCSVFAMNPEKVIFANRNKEIKDILSSAGLLIPDGIGVVLAAKLQGVKTKGRVPGCELAVELCKLAEMNNYGVFLLGAKEETNLAASEKLIEKYPGLIISGRRNGYFKNEDDDQIIETINKSGAHIVLVALGSPKQEKWVEKNQTVINANILQGVGGTFDVIAGNVKRAPTVWRATHLEWLYRLLSQPQRIFRQFALPTFVWQVLTSRIRG